MRAFVVLLIMAACSAEIRMRGHSPVFSASLGSDPSTIRQFLVTFRSIPSAEERAQLASEGIHLGTYIPDNTYLVLGTDAVAERAASKDGVVAVHLRTAEQKLSTNLEALDQDNLVRRSSAQESEILYASLLRNFRSAEDVADEMRAMLPSSAQVMVVSESKLQLTVDPYQAAAIANVLAEAFVDIDFIERKAQLRFKNYYARMITSGQASLSTAASPNIPNYQSPYLQAMGLNGTGQLLAAADSGIDWDDCMFWEAGVTPPFNTVDLSRRKIAAYYYYSGASCGNPDGVLCGNSSDDNVGHGTHVAGSIAGQAYTSSLDQLAEAQSYNGMSFNAKLFFTDIGNIAGGLSPPIDLYSGLFPDPFNAGARVHSNSWGCSPTNDTSNDCNIYASNDAEIDRYMYDNPTFLVLVAAGNSGQNQRMATIESPAGAKNILSVGASQKTSQGGVASVSYVNPNEVCSEAAAGQAPPCCTAMTCTEQDCCNFNSNTDCCPQNPKYTTNYGPQNLADFSSRGPAYINGQTDGRIKPDVVTPGDSLVSAHGNSTSMLLSSPICDYPGGYTAQYDPSNALQVMSGTSMATPVAAGLCGLIRQYYLQGYYPTGTPTPANVMPTPTAALIKATMIASATMLTGGASILGTFTAFSALSAADRHSFQGWGLPDLSTILKSPTSAYNTFVSDNYNGVLTNEVAIYNFVNVDVSVTPFSVVLAWTDCPAPLSATVALINNLDMLVTVSASTGSIVAGTSYFPNDLTAPDTANNVEKTIIPAGPTGQMNLTVTVTGKNVPCLTSCINGNNPCSTWQSQMFALVSSGSFASASLTSGPIHGNVVPAGNTPPIPSPASPPSLPPNFVAPGINISATPTASTGAIHTLSSALMMLAAMMMLISALV